MNAKQREYLVNTLNSNAKEKINKIKSLIPRPPSLENHLMKVILSGELKTKTPTAIAHHVMERATNLESGSNLLERASSNSRSRWHDDDDDDFEEGTGYEITFEVSKIFELPEDFIILRDEYVRLRKIYLKEIEKVREHQKALETRINLASDKTLDPLIEEVNAMGVISFEDAQMKALAEPIQKAEPRKLLKR